MSGTTDPASHARESRPAPVPPVPPVPAVPARADAASAAAIETGEFPVTQDVRWAPVDPEPPRPLAGWALLAAIVGLGMSLFVGWAFPLGLIAIVTAIIALRRPVDSRAVAVWALALGTVSILYSAGWLLWALSRPGGWG